MASKLVNKFCRVVYGKDLETSRLVLKIDLLVMTYVCMTQFINLLDRSNYSNAYISGSEKQDLGFTGMQYNWGNTIFLIGYTIGQIPSNVALTYVRPRYWFTGVQLAWAVVCLGQYAAKNVTTVLALRFFMGLFESSTFVGTHVILGSWYSPEEIGKRTALFVSCAQIGSILSGLIQAGLYEHMNGTSGLAGWQWLFIVDFLISIPTIIYGFIFFPDFPHNTTCSWLSDAEKELARARVPNAAVERVQWLNLATWKRISMQWTTYIFPILFTLYAVGLQIVGNNVMPFFMEQYGDTDVSHLNNYPTGITGVGIFAFWFYSILSDKLKTRVPASIAIGAVYIIAGSLLLANNIPYGAKLFAFYLTGSCLSPQALWYAWANDLTRHDFELRVFINGSMNTLAEAFIAWWPLVFFPASSDFKRGFIATIVVGALIIVVVLVIWYLERRDKSMSGPEEVIESVSEGNVEKDDSYLQETQPVKEL